MNHLQQVVPKLRLESWHKQIQNYLQTSLHFVEKRWSSVRITIVTSTVGKYLIHQILTYVMGSKLNCTFWIIAL